MVTLKPIETYELRSLVELAFDCDTELLTKFHIKTGDLSCCVNHTMKTIFQTMQELEGKFEFYAVMRGSETIGYTVLINDGDVSVLYSFGININYRTQLVLTDWIDCVKEVSQSKLIAMLWNKNTRAIAFLRKHGMRVTGIDADSTTLFCNNSKKKEICQ
jgi:hypothetical protein